MILFAISIGAFGCSNEGPIAPANMGLAFQQSPSGGQWISRQETTISWEIDPQCGSVFESFKIHYSVNSGDYWFLIEETKNIAINWIIPSEINSTNCLVKVAGYLSDSIPIAEVVSEPFSVIPFGMIDHFIVSAPDVVIHSTNFVLSVTAKDQYHNTIINYNDILYLLIDDMDFPSDNPPIIGDGSDHGVWVNGIVINCGYGIDFANINLVEGPHTIGVVLLYDRNIIGVTDIQYIY